MTIYFPAAPSFDGPWKSLAGVLCPATINVPIGKLQIGDILIITNWYVVQKYSVAVTAIDIEKQSVTIIDSAGKVEVIKHYGFERQCSIETAVVDMQRSSCIQLRRDIESLRKTVASRAKSMTKDFEHRRIVNFSAENVETANPKLPSYITDIENMEKRLKEIYVEIGKDIGLHPAKKLA